MARKTPVPEQFSPGDIQMSPGPVAPVGPAPQPQPQSQEQDRPVYSEREVAEHSQLVRHKSRKEVILEILMERAYNEKQVYIGNTLAFIMDDYGFRNLKAQTDAPQEE